MVSEAYNILRNEYDAEDAVHDTFIKLARNMKAIDEPDSDKTLSYVLKAVKNTAINILNKNIKRNEFEDHDFVEKMPDQQFLDKLNIKEQYNEVVNAIRELNDTYRDVMFFHFISEMKISEIIKSATIETKIQKKFGLIWITVSDGSWTDTTTATSYSKSHSVQLSSTGTYRAHVEFTISGSGGSDDEITKNVQRTYS